MLQLKVTINSEEVLGPILASNAWTPDQVDNIMVATLAGPTFSSAEEIEHFQSTLNPVLLEYEQKVKPLKLILDISQLGMVGSMGLGQAIALKKRLGQLGGDVAVSGPNDVATATLKASALERYVWIFADVEEAINGLLE